MQPPEKSKTFLRTVCEQVRWKQAHEVVCRDLADHIEDQTEAYVRGGMDKQSASERAIKEMGDPVTIGLLLDASYRPSLAWPALLPLGILVLLGILLRVFVYDMTQEGQKRLVVSL